MKRVLVVALVLIAVSSVAPATAGAPKLRGTALTPPSAAPKFALHDQRGRLVRLADERGRWFVVTFLYTHCPDVCPLIANQLNIALRELGPRLNVLAISVDPKGDTHAAVARFTRNHRLLPRFRYLTGTRAQLAPIWSDFHIAATPDGSVVSHSAFALLVDPSGKVRVLYDSQLTGADVVHDLKALASR
jgi:protein SCO1/2